MDYYFWIKAVHLIAIVIVVSAMMLNGFLFRHLSANSVDNDGLFAAAVSLNRYTAGLALLIVWAAGLWLVMKSGYYRDGWFMAKFVLVFILSGIHGAQVGRLSRLQKTPGPVPAFFRNSDVITLVLVAITIVLVAVKPF